MAYTFIKFGLKGINIEQIRSWEIQRQEEAPAADGTQGWAYDVVRVTYVGGDRDTFDHQEATALLHWLEAHAEDVSAPPSEAAERPGARREPWTESQRDDT